MPVRGWEFWRLDAVDGGELAWLGITRPGARSTIDRTKVWTLVPALRMFIANWFVTEDHARESGLWVHDNIHISEACDLGLSGRERVSGLLRSTKGALHPAGDDHEATGTVYSKKAEGPVEIHPGVGHLV